MSNLTQTPANVAIGAATTRTSTVQYGESITQGMPLYKHTDNKYYKADANDTQAKAAASVISITPGSTDAYGLVANPGDSPGVSLVNLGATLVVGETYAVSATVGAICPLSDIVSTQYVTILGVAKTASLLDFQVVVSNTAKA